MQEVATAGKDHRETQAAGGHADLIVSHGGAWLDDGPYACPRYGPVPGEDYGVALYHAGDAPGEEEIPHLLQRRMFFCDHLVAGIVLEGVCILEQYAARYLLGREEGLDERTGDEHPDVGPG